jgi:YbbR domain-containing protein
MALRDKKRFATSSGDPWRRLKGIFVEDWGLKLLALAITLVLWFMVSGRMAEREIAVEPKAEGKPAPTFEVKEIVVTPTRIRVHGPVNHLNDIEKVTIPISVEGRRESFVVYSMPLPIADRNVQALGTVNVHVTIVGTGNSSTKPPNTN